MLILNNYYECIHTLLLLIETERAGNSHQSVFHPVAVK